jgi:hypothetical protein
MSKLIDVCFVTDIPKKEYEGMRANPKQRKNKFHIFLTCQHASMHEKDRLIEIKYSETNLFLTLY